MMWIILASLLRECFCRRRPASGGANPMTMPEHGLEEMVSPLPPKWTFPTLANTENLRRKSQLKYYFLCSNLQNFDRSNILTLLGVREKLLLRLRLKVCSNSTTITYYLTFNDASPGSQARTVSPPSQLSFVFCVLLYALPWDLPVLHLVYVQMFTTET